MTWGMVLDLLKAYMIEHKDMIDKDLEIDLRCIQNYKDFHRIHSSKNFTYAGITPATAHYLARCENCLIRHRTIKDLRAELKAKGAIK